MVLIKAIKPPLTRRLLLLLLVVLAGYIWSSRSSPQLKRLRWSRPLNVNHTTPEAHSNFLVEISKSSPSQEHLDFLDDLIRNNAQEYMTEDALGDGFGFDPYADPEDTGSATPTDRWRHQKSFVLPKSTLHVRQCDAIPEWFVHELAKEAAAGPIGPHVVYHFRSGELIKESNAEAKAGSEFCSVVFAPQSPPGITLFRNTAIEGWGPDSLHVEIACPDVRLIITEHPRFYSMIDIANPQTKFAVYMTAYSLNQPGDYQISGEVEFQNYEWVMEDPIDSTKGEQHPYTMKDIPLQSRSPPLHITGTPLARPAQQCYRNGETELQGRWYRASSFGSGGNQSALNPAAALAFADHNTTVDQFGWTFAPDACSLKFFDKPDISSCLQDRTIQILGESNSRRLLKTLMSAGHWCVDPDDHVCECEDQWQEETIDFNFQPLNSTRFRDTAIRETPTYFGENSSVYFDFAGGLLNRKLWNPWFIFYDQNRNPDHSDNIVSERIAEHGSPVDLVHVSLLTWDIAGVRTADELHASLPDFKARLLEAYAPGTRFITRLANNMCCGNQDRKTRFSAPRFAIFNAMWRQFWAEDEKAGSMLVDDAAVLQGRRDAETAFFCPTTHLRASHVRLEAQMWLNAVCDGGQSASGSNPETAGSAPQKAVMRKWGYSQEQIDAAKVARGNSG